GTNSPGSDYTRSGPASKENLKCRSGFFVDTSGPWSTLSQPSFSRRQRQRQPIRSEEDVVIRKVSVAAVVLVWFAGMGEARCADATIPGEVTTPYPTLINLGIEWPIEG